MPDAGNEIQQNPRVARFEPASEPPVGRSQKPAARRAGARALRSLDALNPLKMSRIRRIDLLLGVLQAACILIFVACVALDPKLHEPDPKPAPEARSAAAG